MENALPREARHAPRRPAALGPQEVAGEAVSTRLGPPPRGPCGVARVCQVWDVPRSSVYAARQPKSDSAPAPPARPGPKPAVSDDALLVAIKDDLARSPWTGALDRREAPRGLGPPAGDRRHPRLPRARPAPDARARLLSPHRARQPRGTAHGRHIVTAAPNLTRATDATQITTVQDGKVAVRRRRAPDAELPGWHVTKSGTRSEATQAVGMAVR